MYTKIVRVGVFHTLSAFQHKLRGAFTWELHKQNHEENPESNWCPFAKFALWLIVAHRMRNLFRRCLLGQEVTIHLNDAKQVRHVDSVVIVPTATNFILSVHTAELSKDLRG